MRGDDLQIVLFNALLRRNDAWDKIWERGHLGAAAVTAYWRGRPGLFRNPAHRAPELEMLIERAATAGEAWALVPLACVGQSQAAAKLTKALTHRPPQASDDPQRALLAIGLLGRASSVPTLLRALRNPKHSDSAAAAAIALFMLTGFELFAEHYEVRESALTDDELAAWRAGTLDVARVGVRTMRLCRNADTWELAWQSNCGRFTDSTRWRMGQRFGEPATFAALTSSHLPFAVREILANEIAIRTGVAVNLSPAMLGIQTAAVATRAERDVAAHSNRYRPGAWWERAM